MFFHVAYGEGTRPTVTMEAGPQERLSVDLGDAGRLDLLGDPMPRDRSALATRILNASGHIDLARLYDEVPGHYYWFHWRADTLECGSSYCAILPVYHTVCRGRIGISSSSFHLARAHQLDADGPRYLLERRLFNYPLFHHTPWSSVRLVPTHHILRVEQGMVTETRGFAVEDHFGDGCRSTRTDLEDLCDLFTAECDLHLPYSRAALSFTGGFDGRTLLGAARKLGRREFTTYSFGRTGSSDLEIPAGQAKVLGMDHLAIRLDDAYVHDHSLRSAIAFMEGSDHNGNLGRPHYHYAAELLGRSYGHLITGNFGSELFRAMHQSGVMLSPTVIQIFAEPDGNWPDTIRRAAGPDSSGLAETLISDIQDHLSNTSALGRNGRFHRFVLEEVFRKYFGPELIVQGQFLRNRTPFLSLRFVKALNGTVWSSLHSRLFDENKARRRKGQMFYAAYLHRSDPRLYAMMTGKGYAPKDVREPWRTPILATRVLMKYLFHREEPDPNSVSAYYRRHYPQLITHFGILDPKRFEPRPDVDQADQIHVLSCEAAWHAAATWSRGIPSGI